MYLCYFDIHLINQYLFPNWISKKCLENDTAILSFFYAFWRQGFVICCEFKLASESEQNWVTACQGTFPCLHSTFFVMSSPRLLVPLRLLSNRAGGGLHQRCQIVSAIGVANLSKTTQQPHKRNFSSTSSKYKFWGPLWPLDPDGHHATNNAILLHNSSSKTLFSNTFQKWKWNPLNSNRVCFSTGVRGSLCSIATDETDPKIRTLTLNRPPVNSLRYLYLLSRTA